MTTPVDEKDQITFPHYAPDRPTHPHQRSSDEDGTLRDHQSDDHHNYLRVTTSHSKDDDRFLMKEKTPLSPQAQREMSQRLGDELNLQKIEKQVSDDERIALNNERSAARSRSRNPAEPIDDFDENTNPIHESTKIYKPVENPSTKFAKVFKKIHNSSWLVRYFLYIAPVAILLLIPLAVGKWAFEDAHVGGVRLFWFGIWLEIVWLSLWAGRILAKCIPYPMGIISSAFTNNNKKWRDLGVALELPATFFFWGLALEVSFLPTMRNHMVPGYTGSTNWQVICNKIIIALFVGAVLNFVEKIIIQLIAISFHLRTYADRIDINRFQISSLVKLYVYSRDKLEIEDSEFEADAAPSGARTPMVYAARAQRNARAAFTRVGDVAGKVAGDFAGKQVLASTHPSQVVLALLRTNPGAQILARRLYRTFINDDAEHVLADDLKPAFDNDDEANAAFTMFDKDLNGDISMEELEAVCVEVGRERKAITASLKDLDSVVGKLNSVFVFIVCVIVILVFISIISTSASGVLTSLGSSVLALSWLFSATAQEFLQSIIFVFVKHPFDVGDRVTIYGSTGKDMKGDDYFVKEIALLYTEFKKMEGHVVQAPNSYLNTLFILNQRRSGGLAEAVPVTIKFGTTLEQIDGLRQRLLEFVGSEKREYQHNILTELREVYECHSITLNVVFFYKSNWQNELLRLQRRNKFICALMITMNELGIEGPRMRLAGANTQFPMHLHNAHTGSAATFPTYQTPSAPEGNEQIVPDAVYPDNSQPSHGMLRRPTVDSSMQRQRGESISAMGKRVDFSLGMSSVSAGEAFNDLFDEPVKPRLPQITMTTASPRPSSREHSRASEDHNSLAHTTSRDSAGSKLHKNRFFSRKGRSSTKDDSVRGTSLEDLESGIGRNRQVSVFDMPHIPEATGEASGHNTAHVVPPNSVQPPPPTIGVSRASTMPSSGMLGGRIDPRTGIISPQAVARDSALERGELPRHYES